MPWKLIDAMAFFGSGVREIHDLDGEEELCEKCLFDLQESLGKLDLNPCLISKFLWTLTIISIWKTLKKPRKPESPVVFGAVPANAGNKTTIF